MADISSFILAVMIVAVIFIVAALPLYISLKLMGAKTTLLKTIMVSILAGIAVYITEAIIGRWGGLISFIVLLVIYRFAFRIGIIRAFLAWLLQFAVALALVVILFAAGVTIAGLSFLV